MKRLIVLAAAVLAAALLLCACGGKATPEATAPQDASLCSTAEPEKVPESSFTYEYGSDDASLWIWCGCDMENAALVKLNYSEETGQPEVGDVIYGFGAVESGECVLLHVLFESETPDTAFRYTALGVEHAFALTADGALERDILNMYEDLTAVQSADEN